MALVATPVSEGLASVDVQTLADDLGIHSDTLAGLSERQ
jgi:hypothetical protein